MTRRPSPRHRISVADVAAEVSKAAGALKGGVVVLVGAGLLTGTPAVWITGLCVAVGAVAGAYVAKPNRDRAARFTVREDRTP